MANTEERLIEALAVRGRTQVELHERAGALRDQVFGRRVFVRGVVEVSNFCRENCMYCGMRRDNRTLERYRLDLDDLLDLALNQCPDIVTDINIQAGEDPVAVREIVIPLVRRIRESTSHGVSVCLGTLSQGLYAELREAGADYYIIKLESADPDHYLRMQAPGNIGERLDAIRHLASTGWHVSSGFIVGLPGQNASQVALALQTMRNLPLAGCSVSPFIPGGQTPLANEAEGSLEDTLNCVSLMRLASPCRIIPAVSAMTLVGDEGYSRAIRAGANLATINLTPTDAQGKYVIYKKNRNIMTEERILREIETAGCEVSDVGISSSLADSRRESVA